MSQKNPQELQQMVVDLAKRVADLEKYVRTLQTSLAKSGLKVPTLSSSK